VRVCIRGKSGDDGIAVQITRCEWSEDLIDRIAIGFERDGRSDEEVPYSDEVGASGFEGVG